MTNPLDRLFATAPKLPSLPRVVTELIASFGDENVDLARLIEPLRRDPNLVARVLRIANSSRYGAVRKIGAIDDAVALIGLDALRTLVIASGLTSSFTQVPHVDLPAFWRNALVVGGLARGLAMRAGLDPEFAYTGGLMYRIGMLPIYTAYPQAAAEIARDCGERSVGERNALEKLRLQFCHAEVSERIASEWHFPQAIVGALRWYPEPMHDKAPPLAAVLFVAAQMVLEHTAGRPVDEIAQGVRGDVAERLMLSPAQLREEVGLIAALDTQAAGFL